MPRIPKWSFNLYPIDDDRTRLVVRSRWTSSNASHPLRFFLLSMDPMYFVMERRMILGIKQRTEHTLSG